MKNTILQISEKTSTPGPAVVLTIMLGANYTVTKFGIPRNAQNNTDDIPTVGDWNGDGKTDVSVFRPSNTTLYALTSPNGQVFSQFRDGNPATP